MKGSIITGSALRDLKPCTIRCGLFPARPSADINDVEAIHEYLGAVNEHATTALFARRVGNLVSAPDLYNPRKLPREELYDVAMPPLKRPKLAGTGQAGVSSGVDAADACGTHVVSSRRVEVSPELALFPDSRTFPFGKDVVISIELRIPLGW